jgi:puromycin-sensitive aminopeptidase
MATSKKGEPGASVRPERYELTFKPDLRAFTFEGEEEVAIRLSKAQKTLILDAVELKVSAAAARLAGGTLLPAAKIEHVAAKQQLRLTFRTALPKGTATLSLKFEGILNDRLAGFYRSKYAIAEGKEGWMATTQFEATDARRAFPCWDAPEAKAVFQVTLVVPDGMAAVSNTPIELEKDLGDGTRLVRFGETPRMSTYLLAFIVGPLEALYGTTKGGVKIGVWATPDKVRYGGWALENASRILDYLDGYYGIPYPLPKLDHIALSDFAAGAMENWGAITYRERILILDPASSDAQTRQNIVDVIAHETAHMWFGDLVTMQWWDDLWLNESFASWMGTKAADALHPDWQMWTQFLYLDTVRGLALDGLRNSHPIEVEVKDPAEVREIFDEISYSKGASILRMLEQFLGEEPFRRGLQAYLKAHSYANARTEDLWKALEAASGQPVRALMGTWVKQTGFPLLDVTIDRRGREAEATITQSRFLFEHIVGASDAKTQWKVPISIARAGVREDTRFLLDHKKGTRSLGSGKRPPAKDWIKVNAGQSGFCRVNYAAEEWGRLRHAVAAGELGPRDRLGLQNDAYALTRAGYLPATTFLELTSSYEGEDDATVWRTIAESLQGFEALSAEQPYLDAFYGYGRKLFGPIGGRAGWEAKPGEGHLDALRRSTALARLGYYGDGKVLAQAEARFRRYLKDPSTLHPNLRGVVYGLVAQAADASTYETLWDLQRKAVLNEEKVRLLMALTKVRSKELLQETLTRSLSKEVRSQDAVPVITGVAANSPALGRDLAWSFVRENWEELYRRYAPSGFLIRRLVQVHEAFTSPQRAKAIEVFFRDHPAREVQRTVKQVLEKIRVNATWLARNKKDLARWFRAGPGE